LVVVREWFFRSAGCWGVRSAALDSSVAPTCPPGPRRSGSARKFAKTASVMRRFNARTALWVSFLARSCGRRSRGPVSVGD
jgi:hypothetical protein